HLGRIFAFPLPHPTQVRAFACYYCTVPWVKRRRQTTGGRVENRWWADRGWRRQNVCFLVFVVLFINRPVVFVMDEGFKTCGGPLVFVSVIIFLFVFLVDVSYLVFLSRVCLHSICGQELATGWKNSRRLGKRCMLKYRSLLWN
ncbi:unnamed protein product, partial [Discosporangium mesarthrocarpum]